jgi:hypothetical protein
MLREQRLICPSYGGGGDEVECVKLNPFGQTCDGLLGVWQGLAGFGVWESIGTRGGKFAIRY